MVIRKLTLLLLLAGSCLSLIHICIGRANMLLKYIGQPQMDETIRTKIEAQTRFLRAFYHFMLVIRFMNIPLITEVPEDSNKTSVQIPQSDPREVYRWIIREMEWAAPLLPDASTLTGGGELSKSAAYGLLARVALYMAGNPLNEPGMYCLLYTSFPHRGARPHPQGPRSAGNRLRRMTHDRTT